MNSDIAEIVWALGLGDQVVGVDVSATYPKQAAAHPKKVGDQRQLSAEGILSLKPSIVVGTDEAGPPEVIDQVRDAGVHVVIVNVAKTPAAAPNKIRQVAGAVVGVLITFADDEELRSIVFWTLGSAGGATWPTVAWTAPFVLVPLFVLLLYGRCWTSSRSANGRQDTSVSPSNGPG